MAKVHTYLERVVARNLKRKGERSLARKRVTVLQALRGKVTCESEGVALLEALGLPVVRDNTMGVHRITSPGIPDMVFAKSTGEYIGKEFPKKRRDVKPPNPDQLKL